LNNIIQINAGSTFAVSAALLLDQTKLKISTCEWMNGDSRDPMENEECILVDQEELKNVG